MKKSESTSRKETPEEELKRLRKENKSLKASKATLKASKDKLKAEKKALKAELKKRRHDGNLEQRAERITFDAVPGHRDSLLVIKLCILIYIRTNCGLRTLVKISATDTFNSNDRLVNVKHKDIDAWAAKNMSTNWVTERTKIFRKAI